MGRQRSRDWDKPQRTPETNSPLLGQRHAPSYDGPIVFDDMEARTGKTLSR